MISTRHLDLLPTAKELLPLCQSIAMLDAVLEPEWQYRYYSFNSRWNDNAMMASMRDGEGSSYFILFDAVGTVIKGYVPKIQMSSYVVESGRPWPGVLEGVPREFEGFLSEPAFLLQETTFCIWRKVSDTSWTIGKIAFPPGNDPDGSEQLLSILDGNPKTYQAWSEAYYERIVPLDPVAEIYQHKPLTAALVEALNPNITLDELKQDIEEIGYPMSEH
jgi:hypothetical protein